MKQNLSKLESIIDYKFKNRHLLKEAMTHRSYAAERKLSKDNQRLEFLGDAVIEIIVTEYLFTHYPKKQEGELTALRSALVQKNTLAALAHKVDLHKFVFLGKGEIESGGGERKSTLCDAFEALIGAIYLDSGIEAIRILLLKILTDVYPDPNDLTVKLNPKGLLQEITQKKWGVKPEYKIKEATGPQHDIVYVIEVYINGELFGTGKGRNIKTAESFAANAAIHMLEQNDN